MSLSLLPVFRAAVLAVRAFALSIAMDSLISDIGFLTIQKKNDEEKSRILEQSTSTYPEYHDQISELVPLMSWHDDIKGKGHTREYDTNIMGSFTCTNHGCKKTGWSSKKVAITIRLYSNNRYNAVVYSQRCKRCSELGRMAVDVDSYVERVAYRLKKWLGHDVEIPTFTGTSNGPHQSSLCEGCKAGHCSNSLI